MYSPYQIERLIWFNAFERYSKIFLNESLTSPEIAKDFEKDVRDIKKFYRETWKNHFNGHDWHMDQTRSNTIIMDKVERLYTKWQGEGGFGQLFLWKMMSPETEKMSFTFLNDRLVPSFKPHSLSMIRLGLNFISGAKEELITEFQKDQVFSHLASHVNNSLRAAYGQSGERASVLHNTMTNAANMKHDIMRGFPLVDDIAKYSFEDWGPSFQQRQINPGIGLLFGFDSTNKNIAYHMASQPLMPSFAAELANASFLHFMPVGYIPEFVGATKYGAINGGQSYMHALEAGAKIMLGDVRQQNLIYGGPRKVPHRTPYESIQPETPGTGLDKALDIINTKVNGGDC